MIPRTRSPVVLALFALLVGGSLGCNPFAGSGSDPVEGADPEAAAPVTVAAASLPVAWLSEEIGQGWVEVTTITPPGEDAPSYRPSGDALAKALGSELIVANGAGYEGWMHTAALPEARLIRSTKGIELLTLPEVAPHSHGGAEGEHHRHGGIDPHTFTDPLLFLRQGEAITEGLVRARPAFETHYRENMASLRTRLLTLDRRQEEAMSRLNGLSLAASHPAFNYLAKRYGLTLRSFDFDPEAVPTQEEIAGFVAFMAGIDTPILFWEGRPTQAVKDAFPIGTLHVFLDPLEQPWEGKDYDYLRQARANIDTVKQLAASTIQAPSTP